MLRVLPSNYSQQRIRHLIFHPLSLQVLIEHGLILRCSAKLLNTQGEQGRPKKVRPLSADMEHQVERLDAERPWFFPLVAGCLHGLDLVKSEASKIYREIIQK
jgi:hypothetical protein